MHRHPVGAFPPKTGLLLALTNPDGCGANQRGTAVHPRMQDTLFPAKTEEHAFRVTTCGIPLAIKGGPGHQMEERDQA